MIDEIRRSTLAALQRLILAINQEYPDCDLGAYTRLSQLTLATSRLRTSLDLHAAGSKHTRAADVYMAALSVAAIAILLAELGTAEYPYASNRGTGQGTLGLS